MSDSNDEETYSVIFSALKHPIRRKIMRMLNTEQLTYTQILTNLDIDTGHLNYHLEKMGELLAKTEGRYRLSEVGKAALSLMGGVEESKVETGQTERFVHSKGQLAMIFLLAIAISGLMIAGITFLNVKYDSSYYDMSTLGRTFFIQPNATISGGDDFVPLGSFPTNTLTTQYKTFYRIDLTTNVTLWIQVIGPSGAHLLFNDTRNGPYHSEEGSSIGYTILVPISKESEYAYGNNGLFYEFRITNLGSQTISGVLPNSVASINLTTDYPYIEETDYPYLYYGIAFLVLAVFSAIIVCLWMFERKRRDMN
jgi:DNA-binding transcriptional ArsR family regulator